MLLYIVHTTDNALTFFQNFLSESRRTKKNCNDMINPFENSFQKRVSRQSVTIKFMKNFT